MAPKFFNDYDKEDEEEKEIKKKKEKDGEVEVDIKFRVNKRALERAFYITIIVVLLGIIVFLLFSKKDCSAPKTEKEIENLVEETPKAPLGNKTATTAKPTVKTPETPKPEAPKKNETPENNKTVLAKTPVNAELIFTKEDIKTEGIHPSIKITSLKYMVNNKGPKFTAKVKVRSYDPSDGEDIQNIVRATDEFVVGEGTTITRTIETFSPKLLRTTDVSEVFVLTLYDSKDNKEISSKLVNYSP